MRTKHVSAQYWAGLFDGEGCVSLIYTVRRRRESNNELPILGFRLVVLLANTRHGILRLMKHSFGGHLNSNKQPRSPKHKLVWTWRAIAFADALRFLQAIQPYVLIKQKAVRLGLLYLTTAKAPGLRTSQQDWDIRMDIYRKLHRLNRRGPLKIKREPTVSPPEGWRPTRRFTKSELQDAMARVRACK